MEKASYSISFQVWRPPILADGTYTMIGVNHFLSTPLSADTRGLFTGVVPPESERIPGDVVGFYLESSREDDDGIQFARDSDYEEETVWFVTDTASIVSPVPATLSVGSSGLLSVSTTLAPLISVCKSLSRSVDVRLLSKITIRILVYNDIYISAIIVCPSSTPVS